MAAYDVFVGRDPSPYQRAGQYLGTVSGATRAKALAAAKRTWGDVTIKKKENPGRRTMTKAQRRAKAKRAGAKRRKANAVKAFLRKMNPASKVPAAVKVTKLKGGGYTVKPIKKNFGRLRRIVRRVTRRRARRA